MRQRRRIGALAMTLATALALTSCGGRPADDGAAELRGKRVTLVIPNQPGQGMDSYGRMIAPHLNTCLGSSRIIVKNLPGAGGIRGTNELWKSEPDGLTIGFTSVTALILADIAESEGVEFDPRKLTYLGRVSTEERVFAVGKNSGFTSVEDLENLDKPFVFPSQGTDEDFFTMAVLADSLDFPLKIVTGYQGNADTALAIVEGKADGQITALSSSEPMLKSGDKRALIMVSRKRSEAYPDVPTALEVTDGDTGIESITSMLDLHRGFFAPPKTSAAVAKQLRDGVKCALAKPALRKEAKKASLPINPLAGAKVKERIDAIYEESSTLRPVLKEALESIQ